MTQGTAESVILTLKADAIPSLVDEKVNNSFQCISAMTDNFDINAL